MKEVVLCFTRKEHVLNINACLNGRHTDVVRANKNYLHCKTGRLTVVLLYRYKS